MFSESHYYFHKVVALGISVKVRNILLTPSEIGIDTE